MTIILFCFYNLLLTIITPVGNDKWIPPTANYSQENIIKVQKYVYDKKDSKIVIVGSSLATTLYPPYLPESCFNLALIGLSIYDGLEIIKRSDAKPKIILIETNWIDRGPAVSNTDMLFLPGLYTLRKYLPALREENRPDRILILINGWLRDIKTMQMEQNGKKQYQIGKMEGYSERGKIILEQGRQLEIKRHSRAPNLSDLSWCIEKLKEYIDYFGQKNIWIIFFEMPSDKLLYDSPKMHAIRSIIFKHFPTGRYTHLSSPDWENYTTTDGLHLNAESAQDYTLFFNSKLQEKIKEIM